MYLIDVSYNLHNKVVPEHLNMMERMGFKWIFEGI